MKGHWLLTKKLVASAPAVKVTRRRRTREDEMAAGDAIVATNFVVMGQASVCSHSPMAAV